MLQQVYTDKEIKISMKELNRRQKLFLLAYRQYPGGPPPQLCPSPAIMRRWMRKKGFRRALQQILGTQRLTSDVHLATATVSAAKAVQDLTARIAEDPIAAGELMKNLWPLVRLLRMGHTRERELLEQDRNIDQKAREQFQDWLAVERVRYEHRQKLAFETGDEEQLEKLRRPFDHHVADLLLPDQNLFANSMLRDYRNNDESVSTDEDSTSG